MDQTLPLSNKSFVQRLTGSAAEKPVHFFLLFWLVLNLLQVSFTELTSDEGYYWFYTQHLQWGYYDHPPLIAFLIKCGSAILPGELGIRFFNVLLSTAGLSLFFTLLPQNLKQSNRTYLVLLSAPLLHYLTFLLFPDGPLLFFSLLFLCLYKRFLQQQNVIAALLLGVSLVGMAYAKYHGALVLIFTIAANPRLLRSGYFYLALFVAAFLFAPHLWWQYTHQFPTLKYHLSGRTGQWGLRHVGEYISQQLVAIGPGLIFIPFVCRTTDLFERTLKFIIIGSFGFFLLSSFKTFVHFHWTSIALYPLLYFAVAYYNRPEKGRLFRWLILPFVVLFFVARLLLMVPVIPNMHAGEDYYHGRKAWAEELSALAGNRPIFMPNNLREASLYSYYSGKLGVTLYNRPEKKSQYEMWGYEDSLQGKEVLLVSKYPFAGSKELVTVTGQTVFHAVVPSFRSFYIGIAIKATVLPFQPNDTVLQAGLEIITEGTKGVLFGSGNNQQSPFLVYSIEKGKDVVRADTLQAFAAADVIEAGARIRKEVRIPLQGLPKGEYRVYFGIRSGVLSDAILSKPVELHRAY
jgi:hypothetical protein